MRALLDVNVLVALLDAAHVHHGAASRWLTENYQAGWASCPLTQNGCVRILSLDSYPRSQPVGEVARRLASAVNTDFHAFWPDDLSILDERTFSPERWLTSRQITDAYLLALAVRRGGVLVTLDRGIDLRLVRQATTQHLRVI